MSLLFTLFKISLRSTPVLQRSGNNDASRAPFLTTFNFSSQFITVSFNSSDIGGGTYWAWLGCGGTSTSYCIGKCAVLL